MVSEEKLVDYLKRVSADLHATRQRLREAEERDQEPVAVVEMACRYPGGVRTPEDLWELVSTGGNALGPFPDNRGWDLERLFHPDPDHPGTSYAREGGFVHDVDRFDPEFFGISPREAAVLDPQQRLLLECAWEALERAGIDPQSLRGSSTGVYAGAALPGFGTPHIDAAAEGHLVTGSAPSVLSGRLAYTFGLEGPAVTIDTACSSSLVAVHLAAHALRRRECDLALAGGVTVMPTPYVFTEFSRQRGLAADGRCKPFAAAADGTAFSEGAGLLVLERLADARRAGHRVLAVIRGSAVNQDGASNGLTAPNGPSQQRVIRAALAGARLSPAEVDAVEAHGTGTRLGDPIEADALLATYGQERHEGRPLWLGSVKSNIGHTQGAAGAAGLIKMVQALRHGTLPATLYVDEPTPHADWESGAVRLLTEPVAWPAGERVRRAGVSSFGISGTNAHLILEEAPSAAGREPEGAADGARPPAVRAPAPWLLSARTPEALRAQADALAGYVAARDGMVGNHADIAGTLLRRTLFEHRAVVFGGEGDESGAASERGERVAALAALAGGRTHPALVRAAGPARSGGTAFLFTGQGSQRPGMGAELYAAFDTFARSLDETCAHLDPLLEQPLRDTLFAPADTARAAALHGTGVTQAALFALEVALYRLVTSFGITPSHLTGHSVGEIAAAHVAGVLTLPDACTLVAARGRLMQALPAGGAMLAVQAAEDDVLPLLAGREARLSLAAVNGPTAVVVSGDADAVADVEQTLRGRGLKTKRLNVSHAFHSPLIEPMLDDFRAVARTLTFHAPTLSVVSNLTGRLADAELLADPEYWVRHVRQPVRFHDGLRTLGDRGVVRYLELGPDPVLATMVQDCLPARTGDEGAAAEPVVAAALRSGHDEVRTLLGAVAALHVDGEPADLGVLVPADAEQLPLPTYRFQRRRYWRPTPDAAAPARAAGLQETGHPLLPAVIHQADGGLLLAGRLSLRTQPWLGDHAIAGGVPLPATAFVELALLAGRHGDCDTIEDLTLETPLVLEDSGAGVHGGDGDGGVGVGVGGGADADAVKVQVALGALDESGSRTLTIHSRPAGAEGDEEAGGDGDHAYGWRRHATGILRTGRAAERPSTHASTLPSEPGITPWPPADATALDVDALYARLDAQGYNYGPAFRAVRAAWRHGDELYADVRLADEQRAEAAEFALHPALFDAALHVVDELYRGEDGVTEPTGASEARVRLPFSFSDVRHYATGATRLRVRLGPRGDDRLHLTLTDTEGAPVATVDALQLRIVAADRWRTARPAAGLPLHHVEWQQLPLPDAPSTAAATWAVLGPDDPGLGPAVNRHPDLAALTDAVAKGEPVPDIVVAPMLPEDTDAAAAKGDAPDRDDPASDLPARVRTHAQRALDLLRAWFAADTLTAARLVILTTGAVTTGPDDAPADLATAPLWGLVRAAQAEQPDRVLLVDIDETRASRDALPAGVTAAMSHAAESELALRMGTPRVPRLTATRTPTPTPSLGLAASPSLGSAGTPSQGSAASPAAVSASAAIRSSTSPLAPAPPPFPPTGTTLITGGTGGLGRAVARHLATAHGVRHLLLVSRRGEGADGVAELRDDLADVDVDIRVAACDITDPDALARLVAGIPDAHPLTAVVHTAGVIDDSLIASMTPERLDTVLAPKADAAWTLHELTRDMNLSAFVLFSSGASILGNGGQSNYAAANTFLNTLAEHRRAQGLAATSLAWGLWESASGGMAARLGDTDRARIHRTGVAGLTDEQALALFDTALTAPHPTVLATRFDRAALRAQAADHTLQPALRGLVRTPRPTVAATEDNTAAPASWTARLARLSAADRDRALSDLVREQIATVLAHPAPESLELSRAFQELGFDSLTALELRNRLSTATGIRLPATLIFDHPSPTALVRHLRSHLPDTDASTAPAASAPAPRTTATDDDPIAIVGMACHYPGGVTSPEQLWRLVATGTDAIGPFPEDRGWDTAGLFDPDPDQVGHSYTREGGFLYDAARFDAGFFGISPREAAATDPQQRLLLETAWQAFEHAGIDPATLRGTSCGVITGIMYDDYGSRFLARKPDGFEGRIMTGSTPSVASGRVAYTFGLEGPAITVDTACSSSLVAMHLASQALRQGECELALAGGVTVMATPNTFVEFSRQRGLAPDGRCKPFAATADGTGWGEGAGLVVLERLSDTRRNGHKVLAVIRGSAVNQDGASNGLTAPNGPSQERVIRAALAGSGGSPDDVDVVEAHGTGTTLGDPIEAQALLATYGQGRPDERPLWLGSVKSNIGHTQAAAGAAGVIKMVMALRNDLLPPTLHADEPTPHVEWDGGGVRLLTEPVPWPRGGRPRRAGVSSFGISGTNAHLILEEAPEEAAAEVVAPVPDGSVVPWVVSGRTVEALREQARRLGAFVSRSAEALPGEVGWSLATTRSVFEHRAVVVGRGREELVAGVAALAAGEVSADVVVGAATSAGAGPVLVFPGQGSQWVGMGARLLEESPVFAARIAECEQALSAYVDWSLTEVLCGDGSELARVEVVQPVLWAMMVSLAAVWADQGIIPAAVIGHSQGEMAAACVAGALSLEDAARIVAVRSDALRQLQGHGDMASIGTSAERTVELIGERPDVCVAAVNGPSSTVISGSPEPVAAVVADAESHGLRARVIDVGYASHHPQIDALHDELTERLADLRPVPTDVAFYSTVTAERLTDTTALDTDYWVTNLRQPVRFADTVEALLADGYRLFIEASPHPVLALGMEETIEQADATATVVPTLRRDHGDSAQLARAAALAFTAGADLDWRRWFPTDPTPRTIGLPTYAFQHQHYWLEEPSGAFGDAADLGMASAGHPLLGACVELAEADSYLLTGRLSRTAPSWLAEHVVAGTALVPGAAIVEWVLRAADEAGCATVDELTLQAPLVLPEDGGVQIQVSVGTADEQGGRRDVRVYSRPDQAGQAGRAGRAVGADWLCHATGVVNSQPSDMEATALDGRWPPAGAEPVDAEGFYSQAAAAGYEYGPAFQGLRALWRHGTELLAEVELPEPAGAHDGFGMHPALLDAALHPLMLLDRPEDGQMWLPYAWIGVSLSADGATRLRVRLSPQGESAERDLKVVIADGTGAPVLSVDALTLRAADPARLVAAAARGGVDGLYTVDWTPLPVPASGDRVPGVAMDGGDWVTLADGAGMADVVAAAAAGGVAPWAVVAPVEGDADDGLRVAERVLSVVQGFLAAPELAESRLILVTRGAQAVGEAEGDDDVDASAAAAWGLVRSAQSENPGRFVLLDIETNGDVLGHQAAVHHAVDVLDEPQLATRAGVLYAPRLTPARVPEELVPPLGSSAWRLGTSGTAILENLSVIDAPEALTPLAAGQVRVSVRAAGMNFRDVLIALGMYPDKGTFAGSEGAGYVTEVGPGVTHLGVGDRVMGLFEGAFAPVAVADARMVVPVPEGWSLQEAAAVPVVFLTAWYGLVDLGRLTAGETLLIHAGTGGVGMAATQIARHLGAEVYATASPAKHGVLDGMGIDAGHRASSRDLDFEGSLREATGGRGMDVVLNSLAGEFTDASLRLLAPGGRMVDMGKTDKRDPERVAAEHAGAWYRAFDLVPHAGPDRIGEMLAEMGELFASGVLAPLPVKAWPLGRAREAFRFMSQAKHTGKLVLDIPPSLDPDGTVLITGGTGVLAAAVAEHVVEKWGVRHLLLAGRRGPDAPGCSELVSRVQELGAEVSVVAADVGDAGAVAELVGKTDPAHPLTGVIHAAGVLDDAVVTAQTSESLARVWAAKATAARHLHEATRETRLGLFAVFSSAAATLGSPGQANYAAANAYCDALVQRRRAEGLTGLSIGWGLWQTASGMTGHLGAADLARMKRTGFTPLTTEKGLALLDAAHAHGRPHMVAVDLDARVVAARPAASRPALLRALGGAAPGTRNVRRTAATGAAAADGLAARLAGLPPAERRRVLLDVVRSNVAGVLGHTDHDAVRPDTSFKELGFDSLTAVELRNRLAAATGLKLPAALVFDYPESATLVEHLLERLSPDGAPQAPKDAADPVLNELGRIESSLDALALDDEARGRVTRRLNTLLSKLNGSGPDRGAAAGVTDLDTLDDVSDDEMFEFIDREL
ncbi:beta-ketoacyl synthase [Streptomyces venezuelae]|uniref:Beta-ketoacyl synthase n=1 Tax=Streptomyces venezuelae TaxID=54571 RepID=A0A5P2CQB7_STRVZ|nr:type I polyketide synthase [Streptomyces venezuelae]QES45035.1 beta-ketoacyl synthase [Streptomyces venezuelae]